MSNILQPGDAIESEDNALKILVERIKRGKCVLVLGPRVAVRADDPERTPLDELLAIELSKKLKLNGEESERVCRNLRHVAELYYRKCNNDPFALQLAAEEFYAPAEEAAATTPFHQDLAQLPFQLCICASPDDAMFQAFSEINNKSPQRAHYNFRKDPRESINEPSDKNPLVYHLFGHYQDSESLVLTEGDLLDFLVAIVKGAPAIPDQVRSMLADEDTAFLFIGFGFHNWYLRVLLKVIGVYKHKSKLAFEDTQFFSHPNCREAVGFFSGERYIEFRPLQWGQFARRMLELYFAKKPADSQAPEEMRGGKPAIRYFVSYAHDDKNLKDKLLKPLKQRLAIARDYCFEAWDDGEILAGERWHEQIQKAVARCQFGLLLVTPAFLGRAYIQNHELRAYVTSNLAAPEPEKRAIPVALKCIPFDNSIDLKGLERLQVFRDSTGRAFQQCTTSVARDNFAEELFQQILKIVRRYGAVAGRDNDQVSTTNRSISGPRAFLSYASEDRDTVERLVNQLQARGIAVWQNEQNLRAGDNWDFVMVDVIEKRVDYFIVVQTPAMMRQIKGVFNEEIGIAIKQQKRMNERSDGLQFRFVIRVKIGECNSFSKLDLDVSTEAGVDRLARDILDDWTKRQSKTEQTQGRA